MVKAIETVGRIDEKGKLYTDQPLEIINKRVKIIILISEEDDIGDDDWLKAASTNPAFDFLNEEAENIYTLADGKPVDFANKAMGEMEEVWKERGYDEKTEKDWLHEHMRTSYER